MVKVRLLGLYFDSMTVIDVNGVKNKNVCVKIKALDYGCCGGAEQLVVSYFKIG